MVLTQHAGPSRTTYRTDENNVFEREALDSKKACQERICMYQKSFNEMMEYLKLCHEAEQKDEGHTVTPEHQVEEVPQDDDVKAFIENLGKNSNVLGLPYDIAMERLKELCYTNDGPPDVDDGGKKQQVSIINLVELQRLNIYALRKKLAAKAFKIVENKSLDTADANCIKNLMSEYCNALRDFDYMCQKHDNAARLDPFLLTSERWCDWAIISPKFNSIYRQKLSGSNDKGALLEIPRDTDRPEMVGNPRAWAKEQANRSSLALRFWYGLGGGIALIGPMLLIILHKDRNTALITSSVATVLFATIMAFYHEADASPLAVVAATAAYAAVLVVLVGTAL